MSDSIKFLLERKVGKTWMIGSTNHKLNNFHINGEAVYISTDKTLFIKSKKEIEDFVNSFLPVDINNPATKPEAPSKALLKIEDSRINSIRETLIDTINKIKNDDGYVKKASAINQTVNTLLNTYKTEIGLRKLLKG